MAANQNFSLLFFFVCLASVHTYSNGRKGRHGKINSLQILAEAAEMSAQNNPDTLKYVTVWPLPQNVKVGTNVACKRTCLALAHTDACI